jgi:hypothetical protein
MITLFLIAATFAVVGVVVMAIAQNAPLPWGPRVAWVMWAIAAILWWVTLLHPGAASA